MNRKLLLLTLIILILPTIYAQESITAITFFAKEDIKPTPTVEQIQKPTNIENPDGIIYSYIEIKNLTNKFNYALIDFKVKKSWLATNNLDKNKIKLQNYEKIWQVLPTELTNEDTKYYYYKSKIQKSKLLTITATAKEPVPQATTIQDIIFFAVIPLIFTVLAIMLLIVILIKLNKKLKYNRLYRWVRNIIIINSISVFFIYKLSTQQQITKEIRLYGILPLAIISILFSITLTLLLEINRRFRRNKIYLTIRNIILSLIPIAIFIKLLTQQLITSDLFYYAILPITAPVIIILIILLIATRNN